MKKILLLTSVASLAGSISFAETIQEPMTLAVESGVCGERPVAGAVYTDANTLEVRCGINTAGDVGPIIAVVGGAALFALLMANDSSGGTN
ncbi:hypothetical protein [Oceanomicrobium pacificus]|uniref:Secreted protein n=1 Tax=Oceanomicrobium pacificus TaxID=2692916 RepID=A0A6B0TTD5_9RHOB|nr:hypothetical protein [Oceanomicrobium pacificus]MXU65065.1 hypothetical protein [Oceanomicrobium pacificus]